MSTKGSDLQERFAALKSKAAAAAPVSNKSTDTSPTPLWVYLYIYHKASHECWVDYMKGAKLLKDWLGEIELPDMPAIDDKWEVPNYLADYEFIKMSEILCGHLPKLDKDGDLGLDKVRRMEKAVFLSTVHEVIPRLY